MYHGWLPRVLSLMAGCGLLWRTAEPQGHCCVLGNSWQWTQLLDCKSSTIVPHIALVLAWKLPVSHPLRNTKPQNKRIEKDACD